MKDVLGSNLKCQKMRGYYKLRKMALDLLNSSLPDELHYHSIRHTMNALKNCEEYLRYFKISSYESKLLRIGVLFHDIGFTVSSSDHELEGCKIAIEFMQQNDFSKKNIDIVTGLIMATRIPHQPKNLLEKIICDIDLDYLGRDDFYEISDLLYRELLESSTFFDRTEWNKIQIDFLENHSYHTDFAKKRRKGKKEKRISELKAMIASSE